MRISISFLNLPNKAFKCTESLRRFILYRIEMKRVISTLLFLFISIAAALADDIIVLKNGDIINAVVLEITPTEIKYKKASNPNGPIYTIDKTTVLSIKYENGEVEKFDTVESDDNIPINAVPTNGSPIKALPDTDNDEQKGQYDVLPELILKQSKKKSKDFFPIMALTEDSVISTKELTLVFSPEAVEYYDGGWKAKLAYAIIIVNKTKEPLYIDRARCFRTYSNLETKSFFDNKQYSVSHGSSSGQGAVIGVGPIGIGGGGSQSSTYTENYGVSQFLVIAPASRANLMDYKYIRLSETKAQFKTVSDLEYWGFDWHGECDLTQGEVVTYTEEDTPYSNRYYLTYSTDPEFKNTYTIEFNIYTKYVVGAKMKQSVWSYLNPEANLVKEIKKTIPDFWTDSMAIIGIPGEFK